MMRPGGLGSHSFPVRVYSGVALTMLVAFALTLVLYALDARVLQNLDSVWAKPLKFELALALHAGTLALVVASMNPALQQGWWMRLVALVFLAACSLEMGYIILQAGRAEPSHFNEATAFHKWMFSVMAICAVFIIGAAGVIGLTVWRDKGFTANPPAKLGVILGLAMGAMLTFVTAFAIGANGSPYIAHIPNPEARLGLTGWSRVGGDLRVAHFLATHMIQVIPLVAICIALGTSRQVAYGLVLAASAAWTAWTLLEFFTAQAGTASVIVRSLDVLQQWN